jgi:adenylate cyclase
MRCPSCGMESPQSFSFCGHCGARLSRPVLDLARDRLGGERRFVVVLFADIAGFTWLSEDLDPEEATMLVNRCLSVMAAAVVRHGGRVDNYTGDGLMALFGLPEASEDDPERALRAALAMREQVASLRFDFVSSPINLHIGLACGPVIIVRVGGEGWKEHAVVGASVNLAADLEAVSASGQTLVSEDVVRLTEHAFSFRPLPALRLPGWERGVRAFELLEEVR